MAVAKNLVLSIFPGIDILGKGFEMEGYCVVRGPDPLWGGDIHDFHPPAVVFEGVIGGPPCQAFSRLRHIVEAHGYETAPNLIPEYERCVSEARPAWFVMENVLDAPEPRVAGYIVRSLMLDNRWLGEKQRRRRRFSFGSADGRVLRIAGVALESFEWAPTVVRDARYQPVRIGGSGKEKLHPRAVICGRGHNMSVEDMCELQGLPRSFLSDTPFTASGKRGLLGNAVPLPMARAVAQAVRKATEAAKKEAS